MVSHNSNLYLWWLSWTLAHLKGAHSTQKLLYYMTPTALLPIPNKYASKDFSLLLDPEFKFHSENWRKRCSPSTSKDKIYRKGMWAHPYHVSPPCGGHFLLAHFLLGSRLHPALCFLPSPSHTPLMQVPWPFTAGSHEGKMESPGRC